MVDAALQSSRASVGLSSLRAEDVWLDVRGCAKRALCHEATIRRLIRAGRLRHARIGTKNIRIRASWLDAAIEACATPTEVR